MDSKNNCYREDKRHGCWNCKYEKQPRYLRPCDMCLHLYHCHWENNEEALKKLEEFCEAKEKNTIVISTDKLIRIEWEDDLYIHEAKEE